MKFNFIPSVTHANIVLLISSVSISCSYHFEHLCHQLGISFRIVQVLILNFQNLPSPTYIMFKKVPSETLHFGLWQKTVEKENTLHMHKNLLSKTISKDYPVGGGGVKTIQLKEETRSSIISAYKSVMENLFERERERLVERPWFLQYFNYIPFSNFVHLTRSNQV